MVDRITGTGINEEIVENLEEYKEMIKSLYCCICLDIVKSPLECQNCESLYCEDCWSLMKTNGKKCVINCTAPVIKANKFVLDLLSKLRMRCESCNKTGINYDIYIRHVEVCGIYKKFSTTEELTKIVKEKDEKIEALKMEFENLKINVSKIEQGGEALLSDTLSKEDIRKYLMSFNLPVKQKMELYEAAIKGNLIEFKNLILKKKYPILEEVSAHNFYWSTLHYAMHYGQVEIVMFILDNLNSNSTLEAAMTIQSNDGRCPLLCLLRSNSLDLAKKKEIIEAILSKYTTITISKEVKKEMCNREMEAILKKYKKF